MMVGVGKCWWGGSAGFGVSCRMTAHDGIDSSRSSGWKGVGELVKKLIAMNFKINYHNQFFKPSYRHVKVPRGKKRGNSVKKGGGVIMIRWR